MGSMQHMLRRAVRGSHLIASGISDWATWSQLFRVVTNNTNYGKETPCKTWKSICLLFSSQCNLNLNSSSLIVRDRVRICFQRHLQNEKTSKTYYVLARVATLRFWTFYNCQKVCLVNRVSKNYTITLQF